MGRTAAVRAEEIEHVMSVVANGCYADDQTIAMFNRLVNELVMDGVPTLLITPALMSNTSLSSLVGYLHLLGLSFKVIPTTSEHWPGSYDYMPAAKYAASIIREVGDSKEAMATPGITPDQALLLAVIQYMRELNKLDGEDEPKIKYTH